MVIHTYASTDTHRGFIEKWHVAAFSVKKEVRPDIQRWCYKTFGPAGYTVDTHQVRWKDGVQYGEVHFSRKEDLEWFVLRWS